MNWKTTQAVPGAACALLAAGYGENEAAEGWRLAHVSNEAAGEPNGTISVADTAPKAGDRPWGVVVVTR